MIWLLAAACVGGAPETLADCALMRDATAREDCRLALTLPLVGDAVALEAAFAQIDDPLSRDLLRIRLAVRDPARAGTLCEGVSTEAAATRCRQVLGRPHLRTPAPRE